MGNVLLGFKMKLYHMIHCVYFWIWLIASDQLRTRASESLGSEHSAVKLLRVFGCAKVHLVTS